MGSLEVTQTGELKNAIFSRGENRTQIILRFLAGNIFLAGNSMKIAVNNQFEREMHLFLAKTEV